MLMKSNKLLWINGIVGILGGLLIIYASSNRWHWEIINLVPKLIENPGWGDMVILTSWLLLGLSIQLDAKSLLGNSEFCQSIIQKSFI